jgi:hypothetical protein
MNKLSFTNIRNIKIEDYLSWKDKIFLTFDADLARYLTISLPLYDMNDSECSYVIENIKIGFL